MILVLSLNTAVDRILTVPEFRSSAIFRADRVMVYAGGKGLNVARGLRRLGRPVRVAGFLGGAVAPLIRERCAALGIEQRWVEIGGESRTCVIVVDRHAGTQTVVNEPGPEVTPTEVDRLGDEIEGAVQSGDLVCISGSAPPGVPTDFYASLIHALQGRGARVLVDTSGEPLRLAWEQHPWAIAPNLEEYGEAFSPRKPVDAARHLAERAEQVLLTLGEEGVLYATGTEARWYRSPAISSANPVGSGDAFAAGFLAAIDEGRPPDAAVRQAVACGASNAGHVEPEIGTRREIDEIMRAVTVESISS